LDRHLRLGAEGLAEDRPDLPMSARVVLTAAVLAAASVARAQPAVSGGNGTIYIGTYAKKILAINEATLRVVDSIPVSVGIPLSVGLSFDRKHFYVLDPTFEKVEIIDVATKKPLDTFSLTSGNMKVRLWGLNVDPKERFAVLLVKTYTKKLDRFEIGPPTLLKYDLAKHAVTDTIPWPKGEERDGASIIFSPNGDLLYFFTSDDVLVYNTQSMKQVDRWELSRALDEGMGRFNFFFPDDVFEDPGFYTSLFRITDPVNNRTMMGVARADLVNKSVDFYTLGPSEPVSFTLAPGRKRAYGLRRQIGNYQIWVFDLEGRKILKKAEFAGRPRMGLNVSSNGKLLYIHTAGSTIDLFDTETLKLVRTVTLNADMTDFVLIPH
jgi:DNA-binding beta-propeller fold protein YncE